MIPSGLRYFAVTAAFLVFAMVGSARADNVSFYTGNFETVDSFNFWGPGSLSVQGAMNDGALNGNLGFEFDFSAPIANFQETA
jgi:hypothetical protein